MRFVRVEYGGFAISPENELNAIAFQGVGSGTEVNFVQSAFGGDDGIEMFGGSVNMKNVVVVGAGDDTFDWTFGWNGKVQFLVGQQRNDEANNGIEADNNENDNNFTPRSAPKLMNVTLIGTGNSGAAISGRGIQLRRGTAGELRNFIVTGFKDVGLELNGGVTLGLFNDNTLQIRSLITFSNGFAPAAADSAGGEFHGCDINGADCKRAWDIKNFRDGPAARRPVRHGHSRLPATGQLARAGRSERRTAFPERFVLCHGEFYRSIRWKRRLDSGMDQLRIRKLINAVSVLKAACLSTAGGLRA